MIKHLDISYNPKLHYHLYDQLGHVILDPICRIEVL